MCIRDRCIADIVLLLVSLFVFVATAGCIRIMIQKYRKLHYETLPLVIGLVQAVTEVIGLLFGPDIIDERSVRTIILQSFLKTVMFHTICWALLLLSIKITTSKSHKLRNFSKALLLTLFIILVIAVVYSYNENGIDAFEFKCIWFLMISEIIVAVLIAETFGHKLLLKLRESSERDQPKLKKLLLNGQAQLKEARNQIKTIVGSFRNLAILNLLWGFFAVLLIEIEGFQHGESLDIIGGDLLGDMFLDLECLFNLSPSLFVFYALFWIPSRRLKFVRATRKDDIQFVDANINKTDDVLLQQHHQDEFIYVMSMRSSANSNVSSSGQSASPARKSVN
eukprot:TRINITY_DN3455_c0_g1_i5.p2 TRINITY_DN3455_c0_g1~~TRINITY_DN3455_c0_g1_i5.p2  ORF type:complete len:337 (-),score=64.01 TRINITY_DN3455_c0_g1_i5:1657-2667(-)